MAWRIEFLPQVEKELARLDKPQAVRLLRFLNERVAPLDDPRSIGAALTGAELGNFWKYRVGDFRIVADIRDREILIVVVRIGDRKAVYR
ncbi:type II toxin-antitoxin system RelE/ParE family toxin [Nevskia sp.]|uniref:type II toxin-antitoxin system RelE family toxin n=1 Tax=Nevskia sp. TaxID=1929292 RepID=UPI0025FE1872|nr:type II toxin-antitoxin system RelE/ParE family toxin [Nevskia sp.]